jgi:hypothetical protein
MRTATHVFALVFAITYGYFEVATANATTTTTHVRDKGVFAVFEDTQGDIRTLVTVNSTTQRVVESGPGGPVVTPLTQVTIFQENTATGDVLLNASGNTTEQALNISNDLQSATLQATVPLQDQVSGTVFPTTLDLTFTSTGEPVTIHSVFRFSEPGFRFTSVFKGTQQAAVATGSVIGLGMNFTPNASTDAQIQENQAGSFVTIQQ